MQLLSQSDTAYTDGNLFAELEIIWAGSGADADVSLTVHHSLVSFASTMLIATSCCLFKIVALGGSGQPKIIFPFVFL